MRSSIIISTRNVTLGRHVLALGNIHAEVFGDQGASCWQFTLKQFRKRIHISKKGKVKCSKMLTSEEPG